MKGCNRITYFSKLEKYLNLLVLPKCIGFNFMQHCNICGTTKAQKGVHLSNFFYKEISSTSFTIIFSTNPL